MKTPLKLAALLLALINLRPALAQNALEVIPPDEDAQINEIVKLTLPDVKKNRSQKTGEFGRDVHQKSNGCMKAEVSVLKDIDPRLAKGLFAQPTQTPYKAWIRFSAALPGADKHDRSPDARGMAIKVMGVHAPRISFEQGGNQDEQATQDFVMINNPVFFVNDVKEYLALKQYGAKLGKLGLPAFLATHPANALVVASMVTKIVENPLTQTYFSMSPIQVGAGMAAKFKVEPYACDGVHLPGPSPTPFSSEYLREALIHSMDEGDACFYLKLQPQLVRADGSPDEESTPVEQGLVNWDKSGAPYFAVATIRIPSALNKGKMGLDNKQRIDFCEDISMDQWHALADHRPLGGLNRSRRKVYKAISDARLEANSENRPGAKRFEPTGDEDL